MPLSGISFMRYNWIFHLIHIIGFMYSLEIIRLTSNVCLFVYFNYSIQYFINLLTPFVITCKINTKKGKLFFYSLLHLKWVKGNSAFDHCHPRNALINIQQKYSLIYQPLAFCILNYENELYLNKN